MSWSRFPGYILAEYLSENDSRSPSQSQDLSSFNLNLGDFGQARLVASIAGSEAKLLVSLSPVSNQDGDQINIECSLLVIDEDANLLHQVLKFFKATLDHYRSRSRLSRARPPPVTTLVQS